MTHVGRELPLSRLELVVLARLSSKTSPSEKELNEDVRSLALPAETPARSREFVAGALARLHGRGLVGDLLVRIGKQGAGSPRKRPPKPTSPSPAKPGRTLTDAGRRALRAAFELDALPTWEEVRDEHMPALGLGLRPGSKEARDTLGKEKRGEGRSEKASGSNSKPSGGKRQKKDGAGARVAVAVIRHEFAIPDAATVSALGDALIAKALGLPPGPMTLDRIRSHLIARLVEAEAKGEAEQVAARVAAKALRVNAADKRSLVRALARRWASAPGEPERAQSASLPPISQASTSIASSEQPDSSSAARPPLTSSELLAMVRDAISVIGADGRFGPEKVFVSAIWQRLQRDGRMLDFSLDRFKRWLVAAQRERLLDLARADLVGAMDPRLVAESEIEDLGSTFHFVLDRGVTVLDSDRRSHAR